MICPNCKTDFKPTWRLMDRWARIGFRVPTEHCQCPKCGYHFDRPVTKPTTGQS